MTDPTVTPPEPETEPADSELPAAAPQAEPPTPAEGAEQTPSGGMPDYKGEPLDGERGPGLGCFWIQVGLLTFFLIFTPLTVTWGWPPIVSAALLIFTLILLLFSGQTIIFLLRLVAADRRTRRTPMDPKAKQTVGRMEDVGAPAEAKADDEETAGG